MLSDTPVTTAISLGPLLVVTRLTISDGSIECISRGWLSVFTFHRSFMFLTLSVVSVFSSFCHAVRCGLPPSVNQSDPTATRDPNSSPARTRNLLIAPPSERLELQPQRTHDDALLAGCRQARLTRN